MLYNFIIPSEYDQFISKYINGAFSTFDMEPFIEEVKKLKEGQTYLEIGVDNGKSLTVAALAAQEGVNIVGVDIVDKAERQAYFDAVGWSRKVVFIHSDSLVVSRIWRMPINVLFIDGDHTYEGCKADIEHWGLFVPTGGCIFFHDCDETSPGVIQAVTEAFSKSSIELFKTPGKNTSLARVRI